MSYRESLRILARVASNLFYLQVLWQGQEPQHLRPCLWPPIQVQELWLALFDYTTKITWIYVCLLYSGWYQRWLKAQPDWLRPCMGEAFGVFWWVRFDDVSQYVRRDSDCSTTTFSYAYPGIAAQAAVFLAVATKNESIASQWFILPNNH